MKIVDTEFESPPEPKPGEKSYSSFEGGAGTVIAIYLLYLASFLAGITSIVGVIMAHTSRDVSDSGLSTHYTFQIHTFWLGLLFAIVSTAGCLLLFVSDWTLAVLLLWGCGGVLALWFILRSCTGLYLATQGRPVVNEATWGFWARGE